MKLTIRIFFSGLLGLSAYYLLLPAPPFPPPPPGSLVSTEPADTESIYRKAYYTNLSRAEVLDYYRSNFLSPLRYRLNHPPEESYALIRDQTRSSWLEEIVHPWRETPLINGFYPTLPTEQINLYGVHYLNKITIRMIPSRPVSRLTVLALAGLAAIYLSKEYARI